MPTERKTPEEIDTIENGAVHALASGQWPKSADRVVRDLLALVRELREERDAAREQALADRAFQSEANRLRARADLFDEMREALRRYESLLHSDYEGPGGTDLSGGEWPEIRALLERANALAGEGE